MPRPPRPDDLFALRVPIEVALSPGGQQVAFVVKSVAPGRDGYRHAIWLVPADGASPARQVTLGRRTDVAPRWSPDGRTLAFISDRGGILQAAGAGEAAGPREAPKDGGSQVWLLPIEGGEARQLTHLPKDVTDLAWSPDGTALCVVSAAERSSERADARKPEDGPAPDLRFIDRLSYMLNGAGFTYDRPGNLWRVAVADGTARRLTSGKADDGHPAWSPDGTTIAFVSNRHLHSDLTGRVDVFTVPAAGGRIERVTSGGDDRQFFDPAWSPDGAWLAVKGFAQARPGVRTDVWRFRPRGGNGVGENLTEAHDLMVDAAMNSDLVGGPESRISWSADGRWITFTAPRDGAFEVWRVEVAMRKVEQLTEGHHWLCSVAQAALPGGRTGYAAIRGAGIAPFDIVAFDLPAGGVRGGRPELRQLSDLMADAWADITLVEPVSRWHEVDGRRIQGWLLPAASGTGAAGKEAGPPPLVVEIHGGPQTLYGWSLMWEWQCLVGAGISVYACNPRGSQGYGEAFAAANFSDWGTGPMADVMGGVDTLIADGLADPDRLGVTGGSYGGYLTSWIVGHTDRFAAAVTCRSVNDMTSQMLSGDIGGPSFGRQEYGRNPWEDPQLYLRESPLTYATAIHTPLLIQHSERDLRTTITQAEELFTVLRSLKREVRLMRVPDETHELTRSGTPFRRVANLDEIVRWFDHYLVERRRGLPPIRSSHDRSSAKAARSAK
ncbi:MAG TPA: S9 family peptidase [Candidatus Sulfotelmatobacter sp.]|nr:S9 family peptidase [Candidatus Sulfotelmatobacter sp.]